MPLLDVTGSVRNTGSMVMAGQNNCFYILWFQLKKAKNHKWSEAIVDFSDCLQQPKKLHVSTNQVKMDKQNQRGRRQKC